METPLTQASSNCAREFSDGLRDIAFKALNQANYISATNSVHRRQLAEDLDKMASQMKRLANLLLKSEVGHDQAD